MQQYATESIRNLVLVSHCGAGKTSTAEAMLFAAKAISRLGKVDEGNTTSDYDPEEIKRKISINLAILPGEWQDTKINLLDTPGYSDFVGEVRAAMRVCEGAVIVVCAASGVEVGSEQVWGYCQEDKLPRLIYVNKMDRENADFYRTVDQLQSNFGIKCVPLQLPIGSQESLQGVVDLLTLKAYLGTAAQEAEIPAEMQEQVDSFREKLVEAIAENDDTLLEKYLGGEELSQQELVAGLGQATRSGSVVPVLAGSALKNIGMSLLLDAVSRYLPSPGERTLTVDDQTVESSPEGSLVAMVFKTAADPYVGKLTYFRVYRGVISSSSQIWNTTREGAERIGQLFIIRGKSQEPVDRIQAGDIGGVAKLSVTNTGDTLGDREHPLRIPPIVFPEPIFSAAVTPKTKADLDKMGSGLSRLLEEDPTLRMQREASTGQTVLSGLGETHLQVSVERMQQKFGVGVAMETPKVPYRETIIIPSKGEYKHKKQTGGHGQYGHVLLQLEPMERGSGHEFVSKVVGGTIPRNYIPAVEKGVNEAVQEGILAGYPVVDVRATVYDGSFHPVDSSEICFKIAGAGAFRRALADGQPILLEPIVSIKVMVPEEFTGDVIGDLNTKRAQVQGMQPEGGMNVIEALVPLAEVQRYAIDLKSITQGRGNYQMGFSHYQETPAHIKQKIIDERQAEKS